MMYSADEKEFSPILKEPIHEQILPYIRKGIVEIRWKPGSRLSEPALCREFGVSRTPLRIALRMLEAEGLVKIVPNVGAVVTKRSREDITETMQAISAIEEWAVRFVARQQMPEVIAGITEMDKEMRAAARNGDSATYYRINDDFHRAFVLGSGNHRMAEMHKTLMSYIDRERHAVNESGPFPANEAENHAEIVGRLIAGDASGAAAAMDAHLASVTEILIGRLDSELEAEAD